MGHTKMNGSAPSLDSRIAATLASADVNKDLSLALLHEAEQVLVEAQATIEVESANALDLANPDPDASDEQVRKAERTIARLQLAVPRLRDRIKAIELYEYNQAWQSDADAVETRSAMSAERLKHYAKFVTWLTAEFAEIDAINAEIHQLHARAPYGEPRRLLYPELIARGLPNYSRANPPLRENLKLPKWDRSSEVAFPPDALNEWNARAALANEAMRQRMATKGALFSGDNWHAGRDLQIEHEEAEHARRAEELKTKETADKADYERRLQEDDQRRRLGGAK